MIIRHPASIRIMVRVRLIKHGIISYNYDIIIITGLTMERLEDAPQ